MYLKMKQIINLGWLRGLNNGEHPFMYEQLNTAIDNYPVVDECVNEAVRRVKSHLEPLKLVRMRLMRSELTPVLKELHKERRQTIVALQGQIRALTYSPVQEEKAAAEVLALWLSKYKGELLRIGKTILTKRVAEIVDDAENDVRVKEALASLSLTNIIQKLKTINEKFAEYFAQRLDRKSQAEKVRVYQIRSAADNDLRLLITILETKMEISQDKQSYLPLVSALKEILDYFRILVQSRITRAIENDSSKKSPVSESEMKPIKPIVENA